MFTTLSLLSAVLAHSPLVPVPSPERSIDTTIAMVEGMVSNSQANQVVRAHGMNLVNVMWEDTGRSKGSSLGPNISDMTIGVRDSSGALHPMPVMRFDNFHDLTADIRSDSFSLLVGNEKGRDLREVSLRSLLKNVRGHLHNQRSWGGVARSLWADRDEHVLVSAQGAFLPVSASGEATFTPVIYNYQSRPGSPAVATIVATSQGTSIQVVENSGGYMSEALFFNDDGERAPFTATRLSTYNQQQLSQGLATASEEDGLDVVLVIQVPLKVPRNQWGLGDAGFGFGGGGLMSESAPSALGMADSMPSRRGRSGSSNVESAVIGHGEAEGPFAEINGNAIERDPNFPIRVTVQFYKATSNGVVDASDVAQVRRQIDRVYAEADWVGSLVSAGFTGRPTESATSCRLGHAACNARSHSSPRWSTGSWLKSR